MSLSYNDFVNRANDSNLSLNEKIGFDFIARNEKFEGIIWEDILTKLFILKSKGKKVLDIGCGCSGLPRRLIKLCRENEHTLVLCDSPEMLSCLVNSSENSNEKNINKVGGLFPACSKDIIKICPNYDVIIVYGVIHCVPDYISFVTGCLSLLAKGGQLLIGDIPNDLKKERFFINETSVSLSKDDKINSTDDNYMFEIMCLAHENNCDAYLVPQNCNIPFSCFRDDLLITKYILSNHTGMEEYKNLVFLHKRSLAKI